MSDRNAIFLLEDILESINNIFDYTKGMSFEQYLDNALVQDAVERNFEIIGEAASKFDEPFKSTYKEVDWRLLKDFRNVIIHRYFEVYQDVLWDAKEFELANLKQKIQLVLASETGKAAS